MIKQLENMVEFEFVSFSTEESKSTDVFENLSSLWNDITTTLSSSYNSVSSSFNEKWHRFLIEWQRKKYLLDAITKPLEEKEREEKPISKIKQKVYDHFVSKLPINSKVERLDILSRNSSKEKTGGIYQETLNIGEVEFINYHKFFTSQTLFKAACENEEFLKDIINDVFEFNFYTDKKNRHLVYFDKGKSLNEIISDIRDIPEEIAKQGFLNKKELKLDRIIKKTLKTYVSFSEQVIIKKNEINKKEFKKFDFNNFVNNYFLDGFDNNSDNEYKSLIEQFSKLNKFFKDDELQLTHGDLNLANILVNYEKISFIDSETFEMGHLEWDLTKFLTEGLDLTYERELYYLNYFQDKAGMSGDEKIKSTQKYKIFTLINELRMCKKHALHVEKKDKNNAFAKDRFERAKKKIESFKDDPKLYEIINDEFIKTVETFYKSNVPEIFSDIESRNSHMKTCRDAQITSRNINTPSVPISQIGKVINEGYIKSSFKKIVAGIGLIGAICGSLIFGTINNVDANNNNVSTIKETKNVERKLPPNFWNKDKGGKFINPQAEVLHQILDDSIKNKDSKDYELLKTLTDGINNENNPEANTCILKEGKLEIRDNNYKNYIFRSDKNQIKLLKQIKKLDNIVGFEEFCSKKYLKIRENNKICLLAANGSRVFGSHDGILNFTKLDGNKYIFAMNDGKFGLYSENGLLAFGLNNNKRFEYLILDECYVSYQVDGKKGLHSKDGKLAFRLFDQYLGYQKIDGKPHIMVRNHGKLGIVSKDGSYAFGGLHDSMKRFTGTNGEIKYLITDNDIKYLVSEEGSIITIPEKATNLPSNEREKSKWSLEKENNLKKDGESMKYLLKKYFKTLDSVINVNKKNREQHKLGISISHEEISNAFCRIASDAKRFDESYEIRRVFVNQAWKHVLKYGAIKYPNNLKDNNIYMASGKYLKWEGFNSQTTDVINKQRLIGLGNYLESIIIKFGESNESIHLNGKNINTKQELAKELLATYIHEFKKQTVTYTSSNKEDVTITLYDITKKSWDLSFDPNHPPELRWGDKEGSNFGHNKIQFNGYTLSVKESYLLEQGSRFAIEIGDVSTHLKTVEMLPEEILQLYANGGSRPVRPATYSGGFSLEHAGQTTQNTERSKW